MKVLTKDLASVSTIVWTISDQLHLEQLAEQHFQRKILIKTFKSHLKLVMLITLPFITLIINSANPLGILKGRN